MIPLELGEALAKGCQAVIVLKDPKTNEIQVRNPSDLTIYELFGIIEHTARRINLELFNYSDGHGSKEPTA